MDARDIGWTKWKLRAFGVVTPFALLVAVLLVGKPWHALAAAVTVYVLLVPTAERWLKDKAAQRRRPRRG